MRTEIFWFASPAFLGFIIGFREYMSNFHIRLSRLPKKTSVPKTLKRIEYMNRIEERYGITPTKPFSGIFYFETINQQLG